MKAKPVVVFGSFVVDLAGRADDLPLPGQTILGNSFRMGPGGKGSNQAVAAHRAGCDVKLVTKIGRDPLGKIATDFYDQEGMDTAFVLTDEDEPTGAALISVNEKTAQNSIIVIPGACMHFTDEDVEKCRELICSSSFLVLQHEINPDVQEKVIDIAYENGVKVILNPAPARKIPKELLSKVDTIIPNETEALVITGVEVKSVQDADEVAKAFFECGVKNVVITLGAGGVYVNDSRERRMIESLKVDAVDTTGAGDAFIGGFVTALSEGKDLFEAAAFGNAVGALSVTKVGTAPAMPFREEIDKVLSE